MKIAAAACAGLPTREDMEGGLALSRQQRTSPKSPKIVGPERFCLRGLDAR